jgi:maleate isomerase
MRTREYGQAGAVGLLVIPENSSVEAEFRALMPDGIAMCTARLPGPLKGPFTERGLRERILGYNRAIAETAESLASIPLDVAYLANTGSSYVAGYAKEAELLAALSRTGAPHLTTATQAIATSLRTIGIRRISIVSPYPDWLNDLAITYWQESGVEVRQIVGVSNGSSIYDIRSENVVAAAREVDMSSTEAIVISGTAIPTLHAIEVLSQTTPVPVLSANACAASWVLSRTDPKVGYWDARPAASSFVD